MLSRTASNLFWLARYMERMDMTARLLGVAQRMSVLEGPGASTEWRSALIASGNSAAYDAKHGEVTPEDVIGFMARDRSNPSSMLSCLGTARQNARAVRGALTSDMWEALNGTFLEARDLRDEDFEPGNIPTTLEWFKRQAQLFNGAYANTMMRQDRFWFMRMGTFLERSDNTARILDVKYHVLLPRGQEVGGSLDYYQWMAILRAVSARRAYHFIFADRVRPWNVAALLILKAEMPRSLRACTEQVLASLDQLDDAYGGRVGEPHRLAGVMHAGLRYGLIEEIFQQGLHEFLTEHLRRTKKLGEEIQKFYF